MSSYGTASVGEKSVEKNYDVFRYGILIGGLVISVCIGLLYIWSIYVIPMCEQYGWETNQIALMGNVMMATLCLGSFLGGQMLPRMGIRMCGIVGGILFGGFMAISSFVTSPVLLYVTYGLLSGTGAGILYNALMYSLASWFPEKRGFIMGVYLGLFGLSATIWSKPISHLLGTIGVRSTMRMLGTIFFVIIEVISILLLRDTPQGWRPKGYVPPAENANAEKKYLTVSQGRKTKSFWMITIAQVLLVITYNFINPYVTVYITTHKMLAADFAVTVVAAMGIGSFLGRLTGGVLADRMGNKAAYLVACAATTIACILLPMTGSTILIAAGFFLISFGYGGRTPVYGTLAVEYFGAKYASALAGFTSMFTIITSLFSGIMTATIVSRTGSFTPAFFISAAVAVIGCAMILMLPKRKPVDEI